MGRERTIAVTNQLENCSHPPKRDYTTCIRVTRRTPFTDHAENIVSPVQVAVELGRNFLRHSTNKYDVITISLQPASQPATMVPPHASQYARLLRNATRLAPVKPCPRNPWEVMMLHVVQLSKIEDVPQPRPGVRQSELGTILARHVLNQPKAPVPTIGTGRTDTTSASVVTAVLQ